MTGQGGAVEQPGGTATAGEAELGAGGHGTSDVAVGAGGSAGENTADWTDEPCTVNGVTNGPTTIDCSGECDGYHPQPDEGSGCAAKAQCELSTVRIASTEKLGDFLASPTIFANRTPRASSVDGPCECASGAAIFAKYKVHVSLKDTEVVHLEVHEPWHLGVDPTAMCAPAASQCADGTGTWDAVLWTEYENASAVNVTLRLGACR